MVKKIYFLIKHAHLYVVKHLFSRKIKWKHSFDTELVDKISNHKFAFLQNMRNETRHVRRLSSSNIVDNTKMSINETSKRSLSI